jgi:hypothetical protein
MIQRIQTVYLLITIVLTGLVIGFPLAEFFTENNALHTMTVLGVYFEDTMVYSNWGLLALCIINIVVALAAILLFNLRMLQMRLCVFNILIVVGFYLLFALYYWIIQERFVTEIFVKWPIILPLINAIFTYLALRAIGKDEALVRAADRLR